VLQDLPADNSRKHVYVNYFTDMADALIACQQADGHWTRSLIDSNYAPGYETSGSAFFTYGLFWGINKGYLDKEKYLPYALKGWEYLSNIALQSDGRVGYIQPIGSRADPNEVVDVQSSWNFGVGAFLLAACEAYCYLDQETGIPEYSMPESKSTVCYIKRSNSLLIELNRKIINQTIKVSLLNLDGSILLKKELHGDSMINIPLNNSALQGVFLVTISTDQHIILYENIKIII
jgi:hypothetical protein